ncbi:hypothetical protein GMST_21530 [Geomonas silvestris]|uniref:Uncharacterized protein n=1 Tax=Geomonas silvestris TaxID=2740184 RepID=A0A6V8MIN7_9BACT|nr:hypothetical protein GMST_21530 [Geomonas silvestris]
MQLKNRVPAPCLPLKVMPQKALQYPWPPVNPFGPPPQLNPLQQQKPCRSYSSAGRRKARPGPEILSHETVRNLLAHGVVSSAGPALSTG